MGHRNMKIHFASTMFLPVFSLGIYLGNLEKNIDEK